MPIPTPESRDDRATFMRRCMEDTTMLVEYPNEAQRYAVCITQWHDRRSMTRSTRASCKPRRDVL